MKGANGLGKIPGELISRENKNYYNVLNELAPTIKVMFKKNSDALLLMRVPDSMRARAQAKGLWLQAKRTGDETGATAMDLCPEAINEIGVINAVFLTPSVNMQINGMEDTPEQFFDKEIEAHQTQLYSLSTMDASKAIKAEIQNVRKDLNEVVRSKRDYLAKLAIRRVQLFEVYCDDCVGMIGYLQGLCKPELLRELNNSADYISAVNKGDVVKVGYITRAYVMDTDTSNIKRERQRRNAEMCGLQFNRGDNFEEFAGNIFKKYREYKDMCQDGVVSDESEYALVQSLIDHTSEVFGVITNPWALYSNKKDRPETVTALITLLLDADKQIGYSKKRVAEPTEGNSTKRTKTQADDIQDMLKTLITKSNIRHHGVKSSSDEPCFRFENDGKCYYGENCRFKHVADEVKNRETEPELINKKKQEECKYMARYGNCKKGHECYRASSHTASLKKFNEEKTRKGNLLGV